MSVTLECSFLDFGYRHPLRFGVLMLGGYAKYIEGNYFVFVKVPPHIGCEFVGKMISESHFPDDISSMRDDAFLRLFKNDAVKGEFREVKVTSSSWRHQTIEVDDEPMHPDKLKKFIKLLKERNG
jgi:hypothetical protein